MRIALRSNHYIKIGTILISILLLVSHYSSAAEKATSISRSSEARKLQMVSGKSLIIDSDRSLKRVSIADPKIADFLLLTPNQVYVTGKAAGTTNMILWSNDIPTAIYDLEVTYDVSMLKEKLHELLPEESEVQVFSSKDSIILTGRVSSAGNLSQVVSLAEAYAPKGKINNLLEVGGVHQVMLEVKVAEIERRTAQRMGVNFAYTNVINDDQLDVQIIGALTQIGNIPSFTGMLGSSRQNESWAVFIDALKEEGLAKVLAEPTLIAMSGKSANFLAGGEFPVPVPQGLGTVAIEYKPYGVGLTFTPVVLSKDKISITVEPNVSELDYSSPVRLEGYIIPGITTRRASTTVELGDGESFAIAGLLRENVRDSVQKYPFLGEIPVLGALFRSKAFQKNETELIVIVTPRLVKPIDGTKQPLPTDFYVEPTEAEYYLLAAGAEGKKKDSSETANGDFEGEVGHTDPENE
ncbi:MAG: type II and III secretion system protein family protein [Desulfobacterales bacterium]